MRGDRSARWTVIGLVVLAVWTGACSNNSGTDVDDDGDGGDNPPATVTDLAIASVTPSSVTLRWTAPHGGNPTLLVYSYDLRRAAAPITEATWTSAVDVLGEPVPLPPGMLQMMAATELPADTILYFALESRSLNGIWSAVSNSPFATVPPELEVAFPDSNLEAIIRGIVEKPSGPLLSSDVAAITEIEADEKGIESLEGLQYCPSLTLLNMRGNSVTDLSPLTTLVNLTGLGASDNRIADLGPLSGMTRMISLHLGGNRISDIGPLENFTNLNILYLNGNPLLGIEPLGSLVRLNHLFLGSTGTTSAEAISGLIHLATLDLGYNALTDLSPLIANPGLGSGDEIWVGGNPLSEASRNDQIPALRARGAIVHEE